MGCVDPDLGGDGQPSSTSIFTFVTFDATYYKKSIGRFIAMHRDADRRDP